MNKRISAGAGAKVTRRASSASALPVGAVRLRAESTELSAGSQCFSRVQRCSVCPVAVSEVPPDPDQAPAARGAPGDRVLRHVVPAGPERPKYASCPPTCCDPLALANLSTYLFIYLCIYMIEARQTGRV